MLIKTDEDMDTLFEGVFTKLTSPQFGKNLGGELPLYIQPIPSNKQSEVESQLKRLTKRLSKRSLNSLVINLYNLCIEILEEESV